jgi:hypothetical protein
MPVAKQGRKIAVERASLDAHSPPCAGPLVLQLEARLRRAWRVVTLASLFFDKPNARGTGPARQHRCGIFTTYPQTAALS